MRRLLILTLFVFSLLPGYGQDSINSTSPQIFSYSVDRVQPLTIETLSPDKFIIAYGGTSPTQGGYFIFGDISNDTIIKFSPAISFTRSGTISDIQISPLSGSRFLLSYLDDYDLICQAFHYTTGNAISKGNTLILKARHMGYWGSSMEFEEYAQTVMSDDRIIIFYHDGNSSYDNCALGTVDNDLNIAMDTFCVTHQPEGFTQYMNIDTLSSDKFMLNFLDKNSHGVCQIGEVDSQNNITYSEPAEYSSEHPKNLQTIVLDENNFILSYTKLTDDRFGTIGAMKSGTVDQDNQMTFSNDSYLEYDINNFSVFSLDTNLMISYSKNFDSIYDIKYVLSKSVAEGDSVRPTTDVIVNDNPISTDLPKITALSDTKLVCTYYKVYLNSLICGYVELLSTNGFMNTGTVPVKSGPSFSIYPNPAENYVTITKPDDPSEYNVSVADLSGRTVYTTRMKTSPLTIDTGSLPAGIYLVRLSDGNTSSVKKVIIY